MGIINFFNKAVKKESKENTEKSVEKNPSGNPREDFELRDYDILDISLGEATRLTSSDAVLEFVNSKMSAGAAILTAPEYRHVENQREAKDKMAWIMKIKGKNGGVYQMSVEAFPLNEGPNSFNQVRFSHNGWITSAVENGAVIEDASSLIRKNVKSGETGIDEMSVTEFDGQTKAYEFDNGKMMFKGYYQAHYRERVSSLGEGVPVKTGDRVFVSKEKMNLRIPENSAER